MDKIDSATNTVLNSRISIRSDPSDAIPPEPTLVSLSCANGTVEKLYHSTHQISIVKQKSSRTFGFSLKLISRAEAALAAYGQHRCILLF
jgi:hypothetical protein